MTIPGILKHFRKVFLSITLLIARLALSSMPTGVEMVYSATFYRDQHQ